MYHEEIDQHSVGARWEASKASSPHLLLIGWIVEQSRLAYRALDETEGPVFELLDRRRGTAYQVRAMPTPRLTAVILEQHREFTHRPLVGNRFP